MLSIYSSAVAGYASVAPMAPVMSSRASVQMNAEIVLKDKAVQDEINAAVAAEPDQRRKQAAMCSQMFKANINRIRAPMEEGGCNIYGPPGTPATGMGWYAHENSGPRNLSSFLLLLTPKFEPSLEQG